MVKAAHCLDHEKYHALFGLVQGGEVPKSC